MRNADRFNGQLRGEVMISDADSGRLAYALIGEIDIYVVDALEQRLQEIAREHADILDLDLADVTYCDSSGLSVFIRLSNDLGARGGRLGILRPSPAVLRLVHLTDTAAILGLESAADERG